MKGTDAWVPIGDPKEKDWMYVGDATTVTGSTATSTIEIVAGDLLSLKIPSTLQSRKAS